jgi:acetyl esterase/lipase
MAGATPTTLAYKTLGDLTLFIDVYPPTPESDGPVPALIYFHGGGMTVGDRASWFPTWLHSPSSCSSCAHTTDPDVGTPEERMAAAGFAVISADYRLLSPCTGHDALEDVVDLFAFLSHTKLLGTVQIDSTRLVAAGNSAGGLCAFLAAAHANPKPRAVLSVYGLGGDMFVSSQQRAALPRHVSTCSE